MAVKTRDCRLLYTGDLYHFERLITDYSTCPGRIKIFEFFMHEKNRTAIKQIKKRWRLTAGDGDAIKVCSAHGSTEFEQIASLSMPEAPGNK